MDRQVILNLHDDLIQASIVYEAGHPDKEDYCVYFRQKLITKRRQYLENVDGASLEYMNLLILGILIYMPPTHWQNLLRFGSLRHLRNM